MLILEFLQSNSLNSLQNCFTGFIQKLHKNDVLISSEMVFYKKEKFFEWQKHLTSYMHIFNLEFITFKIFSLIKTYSKIARFLNNVAIHQQTNFENKNCRNYLFASTIYQQSDVFLSIRLFLGKLLLLFIN